MARKRLKQLDLPAVPAGGVPNRKRFDQMSAAELLRLAELTEKRARYLRFLISEKMNGGK